MIYYWYPLKHPVYSECYLYVKYIFMYYMLIYINILYSTNIINICAFGMVGDDVSVVMSVYI